MQILRVLSLDLWDNNWCKVGNIMVNLSRKRVKCEYFGQKSKILTDKTKEIEAELQNINPEYTEKQSHNFRLFSSRELEVLDCLVKGMNNSEISENLFISIPTVKAHVSRIIRKLNASDRNEVIYIAKQKRLI